MWRADVQSLWRSAASTIATVGGNLSEGIKPYVEVVGSTITAAAMGEEGSGGEGGGGGEGAEGEVDELEVYKKMLEDLQLEHSRLSKQFGQIVAEKEGQIASYREKYGLISPEELNSEYSKSKSLQAEKEALESAVKLLEGQLQGCLGKANNAEASNIQLKQLQKAYDKLVVELEHRREASEHSEKSKTETIDSLVKEYSQLACTLEQRDKQLQESEAQRELLGIQLQKLENKFCEFTEKANTEARLGINSSNNNNNSSNNNSSSSNSSISGNSAEWVQQMKELKAQSTNLQFELMEKNREISKLKELLEQSSKQNVPAPAPVASSVVVVSPAEDNVSKETIKNLEQQIAAEKEARFARERSNEKLQDQILGLKADIDRLTVEKREAEDLGKMLHEKGRQSNAEIESMKKQIDALTTERDRITSQMTSVKSQLDAQLNWAADASPAMEAELEKAKEEVTRIRREFEEKIASMEISSRTALDEETSAKNAAVNRTSQLVAEVNALKESLANSQSRLTAAEEKLSSAEKSNSGLASDAQSKAGRVAELESKLAEVESHLSSSRSNETELSERIQQLSALSSNSQADSMKMLEDTRNKFAEKEAEYLKQIETLRCEISSNESKFQSELSTQVENSKLALSDAVSAARAEERESASKVLSETKDGFEKQLASLRVEIETLQKSIEDIKAGFEQEKAKLIEEKDEQLYEELAGLKNEFDAEQKAHDEKFQAFKKSLEEERSKGSAALEAALKSASDEYGAKISAIREEESSKLTNELKAQEDSFASKLAAIESENQKIAEEHSAALAQMKSDLENVESRYELKIQAATSQIEQQMKEERESALASLRAELKALLDAANAERDEYLGLYTKECKMRKSIHNKLMEIQGNIRVFCRVRPMLEVERKSGEDANVTIFPGNEELIVQRDAQTRNRFEYDKTFPPGTTQEAVFEAVQPLCVSALDGYNVCIFAYGQTGSGKTYTMDGYNGEFGVSPRCFQEIFRIMAERESEWTYTITFSMLEIYNEMILDLLVATSAKDRESNKLEIRQSPEGNVVPGLTEVPVKDTEQIKGLLAQGQRNRAVGSHDMNERSSRSHSIITIMIKGKNKLDGSSTSGKLHLIDLAGSERIGKTDVSGDRLKEAQNINRSLAALGDVIHALGEKSGAMKKGGPSASAAVHVPYRNSKLTFLLQDSLGGNSKVLMFVNISPAVYNVGESICSLQFASRCRAVELGQARRQVDSKK